VNGQTETGEPGTGADHQAVRPVEVEETFERTIAEGRRRLSRPWGPLIATGVVGGTDVATGVLAFLLVRNAAGNSEASHLLAGLAFSIGLIALTLARSELFTENFLVPVITVVVRQARPVSLVRLWTVTLVANLVAGWLITGLIMAGFPKLRQVAVRSGADYAQLGIGWRPFALALLGGAFITLMTWMQHSVDSYGIKLIPAVTTGFLLAGGGLNHTVVSSMLSFAGLHTGVSPYGYLDWARSAAWAALGNVIGGVGLVTVLRLLQVPDRVRGARAAPAPHVAAAARGRGGK
jgi:formate/nitrite transporter FocA (FNT family)